MDPFVYRLERALEHIRKRTPLTPRIGIVCGTGLGGLADEVEGPSIIPYADIPSFPRSTVKSHEGRLLVGHMAGLTVAVFQGRFHYYEGYSMKEVTLPIRILKGLGAEIVLLTNAAGGLHPLFQPGDLMVLCDHIHLMPENPLRGILDESLGDRFPDLSEAYDRALIRLARDTALRYGILLREGVYVCLPGPSLETAAETRMIRSFGADAVGMSTVPEVIVGRSVGLRVLAFSVISNVNRPDAFRPILLEEIIANTHRAEPNLIRLIKGILEQL